MAKEAYAADVLSEIESKVTQEVARIYAQEGGLTPQQEETLRMAYFSKIAPTVLNYYRENGVNVRGRSQIRVMVDAAKFAMRDRADVIDTASDVHIPQWTNDELTNRLQADGAVGLTVQQHGPSEEDFKFGLPPTGGRYTMTDVSGLSSARAERIAHELYSPKNRTPDVILATLPRKYEIKSQTYVLDIEKTLDAAGLHSASAGYNLIYRALEAERDNPQKQDELQRVYAEFELSALNRAAGQEVKELDDGIDDE